ncbi:MAG: hypothetical protein M3315_06405 [Actinomycetota bacterium]|nr:hypothetical protein [Actinomycetota bacterium]
MNTERKDAAQQERSMTVNDFKRKIDTMLCQHCWRGEANDGIRCTACNGYGYVGVNRDGSTYVLK